MLKTYFILPRVSPKKTQLKKTNTVYLSFLTTFRYHPVQLPLPSRSKIFRPVPKRSKLKINFDKLKREWFGLFKVRPNLPGGPYSIVRAIYIFGKNVAT